jgi:hypothetical protein
MGWEHRPLFRVVGSQWGRFPLQSQALIIRDGDKCKRRQRDWANSEKPPERRHRSDLLAKCHVVELFTFD